MLKVILQIVLLLATVVVFIIGGLIDKGYEDYGFKFSAKCLLALLPLALWYGTMCITFIPANSVGIKYSALSGTSEDTLNEGMAFKSPFDKIYTISTTVQERTMDSVSVQTKDAQWVSMTINVKYQVNSSNAFMVFKNYKTLDNMQTNLIANATQRAVEEVTTKYNVIEVLGEERNNIYTQIENQLKERLAVEGVELRFITIKDTDAGTAIENAIAEEAVAKKAVETALQNQEKAKIEAETKLIEAEGEAKANAVKTKALTDEVLLEMWIQRWNGELPLVSDGEGGMMIDVSSLMGK